MSEGERLFLIVEPDASTHRALESALTERGDRVLIRESADQALEVLCSEPVDLVIASTTLADGDGFRLCSLMRDQADFDAIPLLFLSDDSSKSRRLEGLQSGAGDYVTKPFFFEELDQRIDALLGQDHWLGSEETWEVSEGSLADRSLIEILSEVEADELTGVLSVERDGRQAVVHFEGGAIVGAVSGTLEGKEALLGLVAWPAGEYVLRSVDRDVDFDHSPDELVLVSIEPLEPWNEVVEGLPTMERQFGRASDEPPEVVGFDVEDVEAIWELFDGERTVGEVISKGPSDLIVTLRIVDLLVTEDHLEDITGGDDVSGPGIGDPKPDFARWIDPIGWSAAAVDVSGESNGFRVVPPPADETEGGETEDGEAAVGETEAEEGGAETIGESDGEADEPVAAEGGDDIEDEESDDEELAAADTGEIEAAESESAADDGTADDESSDAREADEPSEETEEAGLEEETDRVTYGSDEDSSDVDKSDEQTAVEASEETESEDESEEDDVSDTSSPAEDVDQELAAEDTSDVEPAGEAEGEVQFDDLPESLDKPFEEVGEGEIPGEVKDYDPEEAGMQPFARHAPGTIEHVHLTLDDDSPRAFGTSVDETHEEPPSERIDPVVTPDAEVAPEGEQMGGLEEDPTGMAGGPADEGGVDEPDRETPVVGVDSAADEEEEEDEEPDNDGGVATDEEPEEPEPDASSPRAKKQEEHSESAGIGPMLAIVVVVGGAVAGMVVFGDSGDGESKETEPDPSVQASSADQQESVSSPAPEPSEKTRAEPTPVPDEESDDSPDLPVVRDTRRTGEKVASVIASKANETASAANDASDERAETPDDQSESTGAETAGGGDEVTGDREPTGDEEAIGAAASVTDDESGASGDTTDEPTEPTETAESEAASESTGGGETADGETTDDEETEAAEREGEAVATAEDSESEGETSESGTESQGADESSGGGSESGGVSGEETFTAISNMIDRGDFSSAEQKLDTLPDRLQKDSKVRDLYLNLAAGYQTEAGDVAAAKRVYNQYLELFPDGKYANQVRSILARLAEE